MLITLAMLTVALASPCHGPAEALCGQRKKAYAANDYDRVLRLVPDEHAAAKLGAGPTALWLPEDRRQVCAPLEVGFEVCHRHRPELRCAAEYLAQFAEHCHDGGIETVRYHRLAALVALDQFDDATAWQHLTRSEELARDGLEQLDDASAWQHPSDRKKLAHDALAGTSDAMMRERLGIALANALSLQAEIAARLQHHAIVEQLLPEARATLEALDAVGAKKSIVAEIGNRLAWSLLVLQEGHLRPTAPALSHDLRQWLEQALAVHTVDEPNQAAADNTRINLALAALQAGDLQQTQDWLAAVTRPDRLTEEEKLWLRLISVRVAIATGDDKAIAQAQAKLEAIAARSELPLAPWFAAWTRGLDRDGHGDHAAAMRAYATAEAVLESYAHDRHDISTDVADRHYLSYAVTTRELLRLLVEHGANHHALWVLRHARTRALRMSAREICADAQFIRDEPPAPGELRLYYFQVGAPEQTTTWLGIAETATSVDVAQLELPAAEPSLNKWSELVLAPFAARIDEAIAVEVLPSGRLHDLPFQALPWDGATLLEHVTVRYGLDIAGCDGDGGRHQRSRATKAVVVRGQDPVFAGEVEVVATTLAKRWPVATLAPTTTTELAGLWHEDIAVAHIVAHGEHAEFSRLLATMQGTAGQRLFASDDRLLLSPTLTLPRSQVLAAPHVPALVYLSACRSSFADADTLGGGSSLAHALLLRGGQNVVGAVTDIDGEVTQAFATRFHAQIAATGLDDIPEAFRTAYLATADSFSSPRYAAELRHLRLYTR